MTPRFDPRRPSAGATYYAGHGLGNDYLVVEEGNVWPMTAAAVERVCHRTEGVGSDGIVVLLDPAGAEPFRLRMFNPDGSEFERSGNGLRVVASFLHRTGRVTTGRPFVVEVGGDRVAMTVHEVEAGRYDISVEMGRARTGPDAVQADRGMLIQGRVGAEDHGADEAPVRIVLEAAGGLEIPVHLVSVGNPHCVVFSDRLPPELGPGDVFSRELLDRIGPALTTHPAFAAGVNVQLARMPSSAGRVVDALVWERGVGHTSASGTSACAVAVAAVASGRLSPGPVDVRMEGGTLRVDVTSALDVVLRGPVEEIMTGALTPGFVRGLPRG